MAALALVSSGAVAHDFWLEASAWRLTRPGPVTLTTLIGTAAAPEPWWLRAERVVTLGVLSPDGWHDAQAGARPGEPGHADLVLAKPGSHLIAFASTPSVSDLPAAKFNEYVTHEGLTAIAEWRAAHDQGAANGREIYARRAKAIIQVGPRTTVNVTAVIGQSLEIVPETNPLSLAPGAPLSVRLYYRGRPLAGARIECERLSGGPTVASAISAADGRAAFQIARTGVWKISAVWSTPLADDPRADFDTLFASLTFGY